MPRNRLFGFALRQLGVTLLELLVVVALVGVMAAIAVPSYSAYIVRGQRAAAKTALMQSAQFLERAYTSSGCYNYGSATDCTTQSGTSGVTLPSVLTNAPVDGGLFTYSIALTYPASGVGVVPGQDYLLTATPCGASGATCPTSGSNPAFVDPDCGTLALTNTGAKSASGTLGTDPNAPCWQR
jgi:type IV pilus assembly protein PilE